MQRKRFRKHPYFVILQYWNVDINKHASNWIEIKNVNLRKNHKTTFIYGFNYVITAFFPYFLNQSQ